MRKGEELKAPRYASAVLSCDDYVTIYNIIILNSLILRKGVRKGKKFKTFYYTNTTATHNYIIIYNIIPNTGNSSFVVAIYI